MTPIGGTPAGRGRFLVRLAGEVSTKSRRTRARFQRRLADNIRDGLRVEGLDGELEERWSRLYLDVSDGAARAAGLLSRVFGISSHSRVEAECEARLEEIVETGHAIFADRVQGRTYAVRARRAGEHDFSSYDVQKELGAALNPGAEVDLDHPEVEVRVEVRSHRAYLFSERQPGAGGLPLGVQGRALALISGGYDSAVAAWMTLRRGVELDYLFCNLGGGAYRRMALEVIRVLGDRWSYGSRPTVHVVDFGEIMEEMKRRASDAYLQVVLKRLMYGTGARVARETGAEALVTGESVGQVSSQTLTNLRAIDDASPLPVLRPLVGFDKERILDEARRIGTYELSSRVREYCGLVTHRPVTASDPERARQETAKVDASLLDEALDGREELDLRSLTRGDIVTPGLFVTRVPEGAEVLDLRQEGEFEEWHWPGARRRDPDELEADGFRGMDRERTYVVCCGHGLRSARVAERMQAEGFEAYSFRGGVPAMREAAG